MLKILKRTGVVLTLMLAITFMGAMIGQNVEFAGKRLDLGTKVAYASSSDIQSKINNMKSSGGVIGSDAKNKISGLGKDGMDIAMIIVSAIVIISGLWTTVKFTQAGDNPQQKAILKGVLIFHILGLVYLANYFGLLGFSFDKLKIF